MARTRWWIRPAVATSVLLAIAAAWQWTPLREVLDPEEVSEWLAPHRRSWYSFPLTLAAFVLLGLLLFPVLALIFMTGLVFGPWLGTLYALAGSLASAAASFGLGRLLGADWTERVLGGRARRIAQSLERNGVLAVFLLRKVPAPFALVNLVAGTSQIRLPDFLLGTLLGMGPLVVALSAFGPQALAVAGEPTPGSLALAGALFLVAFATAFFVNRTVKARRT